MPNDSVTAENAKLKKTPRKIKHRQVDNSRAAYMREYRKRMWVEKGICNNVPKRTKLNAERQHDYRKRKPQENKTSQATTSTDPTTIPIIYNYNQGIEYFQKNVIGNPFGYACDICDKLWYMNDLKQVKEEHISVLAPEFPDIDIAQFKARATCKATLYKVQVPSLSSSNGFAYPLYPMHLPPLESESPVAPRHPFMQIRKLRHQMGGYGIVGQVINVPIDVNNMVTILPRQLDDDYSSNIHFKRNLIQKSRYLQGCIIKATVKRWLEHI
jgi:hypothetical protein